MHKFVACYPPPEDMEAFTTHYTEVHLPLVRELPGIRNPRYSFDVTTLTGGPGYALVFEAEFEDAAALQHALASPQGAAASADVANFASGGVILFDYEPVAPR
ncbi:MAG: ethyl tert-butyl ether degradation protein EthD [Pseudonocardia sp. SCN 72-86]|nr:MAG: ethyl tert-butyl ether degradation protein EthD [Pseudonocardia sp. SCN 72-86]